MTDEQFDIDDLLNVDAELSWPSSDGPDDRRVKLDLEDAEGIVDELDAGNELVLSWRRRRENEAVEMLRFDRGTRLLRIFPRVRSSSGYANPFTQIEELQLEGVAWDSQEHSLEGDRDGLLHVVGLPRGFSDIYAYGLGIVRAYRGLHEIEDRTGCTTVRFTASGREGEDGTIFNLALERLGLLHG